MKNLHKKIGAMFLAGMVVLGGVAVSGANSFAASSNKVNKVSSNLGRERDLQRVQSVSKGFGKVSVKDENDIDKFVKNNRSLFYNRGRSVRVQNPYEIPLHLQKAKQCKNKFVKVKYNCVVYLIELN